MEYLGFWVTRNGVKPINNKIKEITILKPPIYRKEVQKFMGIVNYYRDVSKEVS